MTYKWLTTQRVYTHHQKQTECKINSGLQIFYYYCNMFRQLVAFIPSTIQKSKCKLLKRYSETYLKLGIKFCNTSANRKTNFNVTRK
jgi:hypothetical protein